ncbi:MAG: acetate uptake transporter [Tissierellia bacterium]|nr:acetate uptake transporter [Tissierellia bacterium]
MNSSKPSIANPSPLGLLGFGMTTVLLNLHNADLIPLSVVIVAMGFALGGAAQIIAGVMDFLTGNMFGATAFTAYGFFWWSLIFIWIAPFGVQAADPMSMGFYLLLWCLFTLYMFIATLNHNKGIQVVFGSLTILFLLLAVANFTGSHLIHVIAGYIGIFCGLSAIYNSAAQILNAEYNKVVLPLD